MAPADDPEIVVGVIMDEPKSGARDGGMVAAPVFQEIAQQLLHELKVPTDAPIKQDLLVEKDIPEMPVADVRERKASEKKAGIETTPKAEISTSKPASRFTRSRNSSRFTASRTALVATTAVAST